MQAPTLSNREKLLEQGGWGKTMERRRAEEGDEEDVEEEEEGLPFLLKDWSDSCLFMASITVLGTFTGKNTKGQKLCCRGIEENEF